MALENATAAEAPQSQHLFKRMGKGMPQHKIVTELIARLATGRSIGFVETQGQVQFL